MPLPLPTTRALFDQKFGRLLLHKEVFATSICKDGAELADVSNVCEPVSEGAVGDRVEGGVVLSGALPC
jgi:hypothetical protein